ncbi:MAG: hypothetical protein FWC37_07675, partial [Lentimicrobiaceae bacterium]|nr:hypothetical protein [Lentimicrobiaceae bacterium]
PATTRSGRVVTGFAVAPVLAPARTGLRPPSTPLTQRNGSLFPKFEKGKQNTESKIALVVYWIIYGIFEITIKTIFLCLFKS